jgi:hypothetical protein
MYVKNNMFSCFDSLFCSDKGFSYRFLPPPVLEELVRVASDVSRTATMITTALTWLLENLPIDMIPVTVRPVVMVLRRIVPFIGYIGAFIAWSITSIKSLDKGKR